MRKIGEKYSFEIALLIPLKFMLKLEANHKTTG